MKENLQMNKNAQDSLLNKEKELSNCNFIKTTLMLFIVFCHSICFWNGDWFTQNPIISANKVAKIANWAGEFHVYLFTLISGYIFYFLKQEKGKYNNFKLFIKNKAKRLLLPYVFAAVFWVIPISIYFFHYDLKMIITFYAMAISPSQLWFLFMLFDLFIVFWILAEFLENNFFYGVFISLALYGLGIVGNLFIPNIFQVWTACQYFFFFWMGFIIRQYGSFWLNKLPAIVWMIIDIILFVFVEYICMKDAIVFKLISIGVRFILRVIGVIMSFSILQKVANTFKWQTNKIFSLISNFNMPIYLFHQQIIYYTITYLNGKIHPYWNMLINFVLSLSISLLISYIIKQFKPGKILIGIK